MAKMKRPGLSKPKTLPACAACYRPVDDAAERYCAACQASGAAAQHAAMTQRWHSERSPEAV